MQISHSVHSGWWSNRECLVTKRANASLVSMSGRLSGQVLAVQARTSPSPHPPSQQFIGFIVSLTAKNSFFSLVTKEMNDAILSHRCDELMNKVKKVKENICFYLRRIVRFFIFIYSSIYYAFHSWTNYDLLICFSLTCASTSELSKDNIRP